MDQVTTTEEVKDDLFMMSEKRELKYVFSTDDRLNLSELLASNNQELRRMEDEKKAAASRYKSEMDAIEERITDISNKIRSGYEHRTVEVEVTFHHPAKNVKTIKRLDTMESWAENMEAKDFNLFTQYMEEKQEAADELPQGEDYFGDDLPM